MSSRPGDPAADARPSDSLRDTPPPAPDPPTQMQRPKSYPEILRQRRGEKTMQAETAGGGGAGLGGQSRLTKLLLNVTIERSPGPVHLVISPEKTVAELIRAAVEAYVKEGRRPLLAVADPNAFELHYSQYSLESLDRGMTLLNLGSRNFFLCSTAAKEATGFGSGRNGSKSTTSS